MSRRAPRQIVGLLLLLAAVVLAVVLRLLVYRSIDGALTWSWPGPDVSGLRWTAVGAATVVGVALAVSGVMLQALLRNPLASPFILGISSGAALGVMAALYVGYHVGARFTAAGANTIPALAGALVVLGVVFVLGQRRGVLDPLSLVLIGVVVSAICGALIMFFQHLVPHGLRGDLVTWMMGYIDEGTGRTTLAVAGGVTLAGLAVAAGLGRAMDAATLGDDEARSVGLAVGPTRLALFLLAGLLAATAVALAGPIGFVGLVAPHAVRLLLGPRHGVLVLGSALLGAALLVGSDVAAQAISVGGGRMPVGVFTALIGGPAFLWLLCTGRGQA